MDALKFLVQPLVGGALGGSSSIVDGMKFVVIGGTVETARRVSSNAWSQFINSFYLTAHFSEDDYPYDWLMNWLAHRPEWQRSREFETTTRAVDTLSPEAKDEEDDSETSSDFSSTRTRTRVIFQPTFDSTHTIFYKGHYLHITRSMHPTTQCTVLTVSVVARSHNILKDLVRTARKGYEAASVHKIQLFSADAYGGWRYSDVKHKRPLASVVLEPGVKERVVADARDFLASEKWYSDRGIPFRRGYLLHGIPGSGKSSLIHAIASELELDVYVLSLSAPWMSDDRLQQLLGVVPKGTMVLLEDLDAAFTRSTTREEDEKNASSDSSTAADQETATATTTTFSGRRARSSRLHRSSRTSSTKDTKKDKKEKKDKDRLNDVNTLSLSGLLNALDGVAASEGRLLFATTNHIERLDPALRRPGRMDIWVEFKYATRAQAEALYRNFFPCVEGPVWRDGSWVKNTASEAETEKSDVDNEESIEGDGEMASDAELASMGLGNMEVRSMKLESECTEEEKETASSSSSSLLGSLSIGSLWSSSSKSSASEPKPTTTTPSLVMPSIPSSTPAAVPPASPSNAASQLPFSNELRAKTLLDAQTMNKLAALFAEGFPENEFSMAQLQGYLLKHKSQPEVAAHEMTAWVKNERELRVKLAKERAKAKAEREKRAKERKEREKKEKAKEAAEKEKTQTELEEKEKELQAVKKELEEQKKKTGEESKTTEDGDTVVVSKEDGTEDKKEEDKENKDDDEEDGEDDEDDEESSEESSSSDEDDA
ncbi:AAA ATPase family protein [Pleurotus pulmonarius]